MEPVLSAIYLAIDEVNAMRPPSEQLFKALDTPLAGENAELDSLGLVNFIVAVETSLEQLAGVSLNLADAQALAEEKSPFRTIGTFAAYVSRRLEEKRNGANA